MQKTALITGGGSGLGQALAWQLAQQGLKVFIVGRRAAALKQTEEKFPDSICSIVADVSLEGDRNQLLKALDKVENVDFLIHNAAIINPIKPLLEVSESELQVLLNINLIAPIQLNKLLLPKLKNSRILNISSGFAHFAAKNFGPYCMSKAGLFMSKEILNAENEGETILLGSVMPGIVATPMQATIRNQPNMDYFVELHEKQELVTAEVSARFLKFILLESSDAEFIEGDWDIYEEKHQLHWLGDDKLYPPG